MGCKTCGKGFQSTPRNRWATNAAQILANRRQGVVDNRSTEAPIKEEDVINLQDNGQPDTKPNTDSDSGQPSTS